MTSLPHGPQAAPPAGNAEVWVARVTAAIDHSPALARVLSASERTRVDRLLRQGDRRRALASFGLLRLLLARYLCQEPSAIHLDRSCTGCGQPHGRPTLPSGHTLRFSVSHSGDLVVYAFATGQEVGVDVEAPRAVETAPPTGQLMAEVLTAAERTRVESAPTPSRWPLFLRYWTRKEAVLKSLGAGLSISPATVALASPVAAERVRLLAPDGRPRSVWVTTLDVATGHAAALAAANRVRAITVRPLELDRSERRTAPVKPPFGKEKR